MDQTKLITLDIDNHIVIHKLENIQLTVDYRVYESKIFVNHEYLRQGHSKRNHLQFIKNPVIILLLRISTEFRARLFSINLQIILCNTVLDVYLFNR